MLVRPLPFPDELVRGYLGRVMRRNGVGSEKELIGLMQLWAEFSGTPSKDLTCLELLAAVANLDSKSFARKHTTLPLRRGITINQPDLEHGSALCRSILWRSGMRLARPGAYCCEKCIAEDLDFHGESYWRREHQIPGRFWCEKHDTPLHFLVDESAFLRSPSRCLAEAHVVDAPWVREVRQNEAVQRYLAICSGLMDRPAPISTRRAAAVLRDAARGAGYRSHRGCTYGEELRGRVIDVFGRPWLETVLPALAAHVKGERADRLSGLPFANGDCSSVYAFLLILAILFESADEAMNALLQHGRGKDAGPREVAPELSWDTLVSAYVECKGNYSKTVQKVAANRDRVISRLREAGLPNFADRKGHNLGRAAQALFIERRSFEESLAIGGVSENALLRLLLAAGRPVEKILRQIEPPKCSKSGKRCRRRLTPVDLGAVARAVPTTAT